MENQSTHPSPRAWISFAQGTHDDQVRGLVAELRSNGVECTCSLFEQRPAGGWSRYMSMNATDNDFILVVNTPAYLRRFRLEEDQGVGNGATFESMLLARRVVEAQGRDHRVIPIVFDEVDLASIVPFLADETHFVLDRDLESLLRAIHDRPLDVLAPLGAPPNLPTRAQPDTGSSRFDAESRDFFDEIDGGLPNYIVSIAPFEYSHERFSLEQLRSTMGRSSINSQSHGWGIPYDGNQLLHGGEYLFGEIDESFHIEAWRFYRSGQFMMRTVPHETQETDFQARARTLAEGRSPYRAPRSTAEVIGFISFVHMVTFCSISYEFAARLARNLLEGDRVRVTFGFANVQDFALGANDLSQRLYDIYRVRFARPIHETVVSRDDLMTDPMALARESLLHLGERFNWPADRLRDSVRVQQRAFTEWFFR